LRLGEIGKFVEGVMDSRVGAAPAPPASSRSENPDCPRQVIGRVPMIERRSVGLIGQFGAHREVSFPHQPFSPACRERLFTRLGAPLLNIESSDLPMAA
jgi:hypothetical protein